MQLASSWFLRSQFRIPLVQGQIAADRRPTLPTSAHLNQREILRPDKLGLTGLRLQLASVVVENMGISEGPLRINDAADDL